MKQRSAPGETGKNTKRDPDRDWEWAEVAGERLAIAQRWAPFFLAGAVAISILLLAVLWPEYRVETLTIWVLLHAACAAVVAVSLHRATSPDHRTDSGLPLPTILGAGLIGLAWGAPTWLDSAGSRSELVQWQHGAFLLLVTFGAFAFLEGAAVLSRNVLAPAWTLYATSLFVYDSSILGLAALAFMTIVILGTHMRRRMSDEMLKLQTTSQHQAVAARWESEHDALTGVLNRHGLRTHLDDLTESSHFVLLVGIDHFKTVNDEHGIVVGDSVLREAAQRIGILLNDGEPLARVSGDEFVVITPGRESEAATRLAAEIRDRINDPMFRDGQAIHVTSTVGMTQALGRPLDLGRALRESDHALRKAKRSGRCQTLLFNQRLERDLEERLRLETGLRRALINGELEVWGQPIVSLENRTISHVELVARWIKADGSRVPPSIFIPLAQDLGIMGDLTDHMLRGAARALAMFADHHWLRHAEVIVNAQAAEMSTRDMLGAVAAVIDEYEIDPARLNIEVRGTRASDLELARPLFAGLDALGVGVGVDDFNANYHGLRDIPLRRGVVRLDKTLVRGAETSKAQRSLLSLLNDVGAELGFTVVAEGVEDQETIEHVMAAGVSHAQGFLFARAMPLERLATEATAHSVADALASATSPGGATDGAHARPAQLRSL